MPRVPRVVVVLAASVAGLLGYLAWDRAAAPARRDGGTVAEGLRATPVRRLPAATAVRANPSEPAPPRREPPAPSHPERELASPRPGRLRSPSDAGLAGLEALEALDEPLHAFEHPTIPPHRHAPAPVASLAPPLPPVEPGAGAEPASEAPRVRLLESSVVARWQHPGLCATSDEGIDIRDLMRARFRPLDWGGGALLYLDPRLADGAHQHLLDELTVAEREIRSQLSLEPSRPNVFAYQDTALLLAAACTNEDVVAYYDGDVHVVATDADVSQSVIHEYTHHALQTAGIVGPAWAQEGIAMTVARETWWRRRGWLERVAARPFSIDAMESAVPYTLSSEQALAFYVQAAAMVACAVHEQPQGLRHLVDGLRPASQGSALEYELPPLAEPRAFRACSALLLR